MKKTIDHLRYTVSRRLLETVSGVKDPIGPDGTPSPALEARVGAIAEQAAASARARLDAELAEVRRELEATVARSRRG